MLPPHKSILLPPQKIHGENLTGNHQLLRTHAGQFQIQSIDTDATKSYLNDYFLPPVFRHALMMLYQNSPFAEQLQQWLSGERFPLKICLLSKPFNPSPPRHCNPLLLIYIMMAMG
jgi:hypothetical protein